MAKSFETITTDFSPERNADGIPCPECNGYAEEATDERSIFTAEEIAGEMNCGRNWACCIGAYICRLCNKRILARAQAPECD